MGEDGKGWGRGAGFNQGGARQGFTEQGTLGRKEGSMGSGYECHWGNARKAAGTARAKALRKCPLRSGESPLSSEIFIASRIRQVFWVTAIRP